MLILQITSDELYNIVYQSSKKAVNELLEEKNNSPESAIDAEYKEKFITKKEVAAIASVSTSTVDNWARAGKITRHYFGASVRFFQPELMEFLKKNKA